MEKIVLTDTKARLQVQTWGRVQYINFDEWMTGMGPHGFNGIIFMERK